MTDEQQIDFTLVRERLEFIEFKQNLGDNNMRAMTVAGLVVLGASENTLPASLEFGKLQKETRLAIATIIGEIDDEWLGKSDLIIKRMLDELKPRNL